MKTFSHLGYSPTVGYVVRSNRLAGHRDNNGKVHALSNGPANPYEGACYDTACGRKFYVDFSGEELTAWKKTEESVPSCKACRKALGIKPIAKVKPAEPKCEKCGEPAHPISGGDRCRACLEAEMASDLREIDEENLKRACLEMLGLAAA